MKKLLSLVAFLVLLGGGLGKALAAPCSLGTLPDYVSLSSAGCTVNGLALSNFTIDAFPGATSPIAAGDVQLAPAGDGLVLTGGSVLSANAGELLGLRFLFQLSGPGLAGATVALGDDPMATGDGAITVLIGVTDALGAPLGDAIAFALDGLVDTPASFISPPSSFFDVFVEIGIDGGTVGSASMGPGLATVSFATVQAVPEPATLLLLALALLALALFSMAPATPRRGLTVATLRCARIC